MIYRFGDKTRQKWLGNGPSSTCTSHTHIKKDLPPLWIDTNFPYFRHFYIHHFFQFFQKKILCEAKQTIPHTQMWFNTKFARGFSNVNLHTLYSIDSHEIWQHYTHLFWKHLSSTLLSSFIWYMGRNFL